MELSNNKNKAIILEDIRKSGLKDTQTTFTVLDNQDLKFEIIPNIDYWDVKKYNSSGKLDDFIEITKGEFYNKMLFNSRNTKHQILKKLFYSILRNDIALNPNALGYKKGIEEQYFKDLIDNLHILLPNIPLSRKPEETKKDDILKSKIPISEIEKFLSSSGKKKLRILRRVLDFYIAGEEQNKVLIFFLGFSGYTNYQQIIITTGESSSGKSFIDINVLRLFPKDDVFRITGSSEKIIEHSVEELNDKKIIYVSEAKKNFNLIERFKDLGDEGIIYRYTIKDKDTNEFKIKTNIINKLAILTTSTLENLDDEFRNRSWTLETDMSKKQTNKVVNFLFNKEATLLFKSKKQTRINNLEDLIKESIKTLENTYKIEEYEVYIPYVNILKSILRSDLIRIRRDQNKLISLIKIITLFNHHNRDKLKLGDNRKIILSEPEDLGIALEIGNDILFNITQNLSPEKRKIIEMFENIDKTNGIFEEVSDIKKDYSITETFGLFKERENYTKSRKSIERLMEDLEEQGFLIMEKRSNVRYYQLSENMNIIKSIYSFGSPEYNQLIEDCQKTFEEIKEKLLSQSKFEIIED